MRKSRPGVIVAVIAGVVIVVGAIGGGLAFKAADDQHTATVHAAQLAAKRKAAADAAKAAADEKAATESAERTVRATLISDLEKSVKKTAKKDVTDGILDGPILDVSCTPLGGGSTDDLTQKTATLQCFAANKKNDDGTENGYNFSATMNWDTSEYSWRLGS